MSSFQVQPPNTASVYSTLSSSIGEAMCGQESTVWTPASGEQSYRTPLTELFVDELADSGRAVLDGTMRLYRAALESHDPVVRMTAQAIVIDWAKRHADYHLGEALADAGVTA